MTMPRNRRLLQSIAVTTLLTLLFQILLPPLTQFGHAQSASSGSPDFSGYAPPGSSGASVDKVTGNFRFSLPVLTVPGATDEGYSLTLDYNGPSPESEPSWVGFGWSLSPGAIVRHQNGLPDDFHGQAVLNIDKRPSSRVTALEGNVGVELFSAIKNDAGDAVGEISVANLNARLGFVSDSEIGTYSTYGLGLGLLHSAVGLQYSGSGQGHSWSPSFNPFGAIYSAIMHNVEFESDDWWVNAGMQQADRAVGATTGMFSGWASYRWHATVPRGIPFYPQDISRRKLSFSLTGQFNPGQAPIGLEAGIRLNQSHADYEVARLRKAYGFMYSGSADITEDDLMDFREDGKHMLDREDRYLPVPVADPDRFNVSAQGISGVFRAYQASAGHFRDARMDNTSRYGLQGSAGGGGASSETGAEGGAGFNISLGASIFLPGSGDTTTVGAWPLRQSATDLTEVHAFDGTGDEPFYFAFENDPARYSTYGTLDAILQADLTELTGSGPRHKVRFPVLNQPIADRINDGQRVQRSSHIRFNTIGDCLRKTTAGGTDKYYKRFTQDPDVLAHLDHAKLNMADQAEAIGEFEVIGTEGSRYTFGLPVYTRNQVDLSVSLRNNPGLPDILPSEIHDHKLATYPVPEFSALNADAEGALESYAYGQGHVTKSPYASTFLLTSIVSQDYLDVDENGPSQNDLGSYVRFGYQQAHGDPDKTDNAKTWYKYRSPYVGLRYDEGEVGDSRDDRGSFTAGEKEVYYLETIETKTHIADFVTETRSDGYGVTNYHDPAEVADGATIRGKTLEYLDHINLYKKTPEGARGALLEKVQFEYDYALVPDVHGNDGTPVWVKGENINADKGRLTLKRIWTERNGVVSSRINPYAFAYNYKQLDSGELPELPAAYRDFFGEYPSTLVENPAYRFNNSNRWGVIRQEASGFADRHIAWEDQDLDDPAYDPAAYYLKQVTTPSGSTVLPQYERGDYRYVQDRTAGVMTPLVDVTGAAKNRYYLDLATIGVDNLSASQADIVDYLQDYFSQKAIVAGDETVPDYEEMLYFKFLYTLKGSTDPLLDGNCNNFAFIDGFVPVVNVGYDSAEDLVYIDMQDSGAYALPLEVCQEYARKHPLVRNGNACSAPAALRNADEALPELLQQMQASGATSAKTNRCKRMNYGLSFLRLPLLPGMSKRGGDVRVKRLLVLDEGLETGDAMLFGQEFHYTTEDAWGNEVSSGVATNEPLRGEEENMLLNVLPKTPRKVFAKAVAGKDKEKLRGPLGKSFLPGPSVLYSDVIAHSIHSGPSGQGFVHTEYFTHKDKPTRILASPIQMPKPFSKYIPTPFSVRGANKQWATQGFEIHHSSLPGQIRQQTAYGGSYADPGTWYRAEIARHTYFEEGDPVPALDRYSTEDQLLGHHEEIYFLGKGITETVRSKQIEVDATFGLAPPVFIPIPTFWYYDEGYFNGQFTHATTRVIQNPAFLKSVETIRSGKRQVVYHTGYAPGSGQSICSATTDGYAGLSYALDGHTGLKPTHQEMLYAYNLPAHQHDKDLGGAWLNDRALLQSDVGTLENVFLDKVVDGGKTWLEVNATNGASACNVLNRIFPGDLLKVLNIPATGYDHSVNNDFYHVLRVSGTRIYLAESDLLEAPNASNFSAVDVEIIRSGRKNLLDTDAGAISFYAEEMVADTNPAMNAQLPALVAYLNGFIPAPSYKNIFSLRGQPFSALLMFAEEGCQPIAMVPEFDIFVIEFFGDGTGKIYYGGSDESVARRVIDISYGDPAYYDGKAGWFAIDPETGNLVWIASNAPCSPVHIFDPCDGSGQEIALEGVIGATATHLVDSVNYDRLPFAADPARDNPYENGERGRYHDGPAYVYSADAARIDTAGHSTLAGILTEFKAFRFGSGAENPAAWIREGEPRTFNADGKVMETLNAEGISTATRFSYEAQLPIFSTHNAQTAACLFESMETAAFTDATPGPDELQDSRTALAGMPADLDSSIAHSGLVSLKMNIASLTELDFHPLTADATTVNSGLRARFWVRQHSPAGEYFDTIEDRFQIRLEDAGGAAIVTANAQKVGQTGEWCLLEALFPSGFCAVDDPLHPVVVCNRFGSDFKPSITLWLDDIKLQPVQSTMTCNVYDPLDGKVLTTFGDNHFGAYFQYNFKNELTRKQMETTEGMKTISEQHSHLKTN